MCILVVNPPLLRPIDCLPLFLKHRKRRDALLST
jgi:hypothetical protein